jgi:hypothetical protein
MEDMYICPLGICTYMVYKTHICIMFSLDFYFSPLGASLLEHTELHNIKSSKKGVVGSALKERAYIILRGFRLS